MDSLMAFEPVSENLKDYAKNLDKQTIGSKIKFDLKEIDPQNTIVFVGLKKNEKGIFNKIREEFYSLFIHENLEFDLFDAGDFVYTEEEIQSPEAMRFVLEDFHQSFQRVILLSEEKRCIFHQLLNCGKKKWANLAVVDSEFGLHPETHALSSINYISKLLKENLHSLGFYSHLGYQKYLCNPLHLKLLEDLDFEHVRIGNLTVDILEAEPSLRLSNAISFCASAIQGYVNSNGIAEPNGFNPREICTLARFAGFSRSARSIGIQGLGHPDSHESRLIAQVLWHVLDGHLNMPETFDENSDSLENYFVEGSNFGLRFFRQPSKNIWWVRMEQYEGQNLQPFEIIPATINDYHIAKHGNIPNRLWKFHARNQV